MLLAYAFSLIPPTISVSLSLTNTHTLLTPSSTSPAGLWAACCHSPPPPQSSTLFSFLLPQRRVPKLSFLPVRGSENGDTGVVMELEEPALARRLTRADMASVRNPQPHPHPPLEASSLCGACTCLQDMLIFIYYRLRWGTPPRWKDRMFYADNSRNRCSWGNVNMFPHHIWFEV